MNWLLAYLTVGLLVGYAVLAHSHSWNPRKLIVHPMNWWVFPLAMLFWFPVLLLAGYAWMRRV